MPAKHGMQIGYLSPSDLVIDPAGQRSSEKDKRSYKGKLIIGDEEDGTVLMFERIKASISVLILPSCKADFRI